MNETLRELLSMAPALGAGMSGNGNAMQAFMQGFQKSRQQWEQTQRQKQQDELSLQDRGIRLEDRNRNIDRQTAADQAAEQDRLLRFGQMLNQAPANAETLPEAEGAVDAAFGLMTPEQQARLAPVRDRAMVGAQQVVTKGQRDRVMALLDRPDTKQWLENHPDQDPEFVRLPRDITKFLGKPSAKMSELQEFTQRMVGKPQGKKRAPEEEFFDPATTPERKAELKANRKEWNQADDRAPRVTVNTGTNDARTNSRIDRITGSFNTSPIVKEFNEVQAQHQTIAQLVNSNWSGPADMSIVFGFMKALDPNSVVRETEYANASKSGNIFSGWAARFNGALSPNGGFLSPQVKADFLRTIESRMSVKRAQYDNLRKQTVQKIDRIKDGAPETGDEAVTDYGAAFPPPDTSKDSAAGGGAPKFVVGQKVRNKKTGEIKEVTGVQPDGTPILGVVKPK